MIGITNSTSSGEIKVGLVTISLTTNQSTHSDLLGVSFVVTYEGFSERFTWNGVPIAVVIPNGVLYSVSPEDVDGYKTPSVYNDVSAEGYKITLALEYKCTIVTIKMDDNQPNYDDIANATATVIASGMATKKVSNNGTVKVPTGENCSITWSEITGYKTPDKQTFTASGTSVTKTGTYQTEILTVNVTSDIGLPPSYTVTVSGIGSQTTASKVYKVPFGTNYTVSATAAGGYNKVKDQTFTASQASRTVSVVYYEKTFEIPSITGATDLSKQDVHGASTNMNTANCYVVKASGTYAFPLVYGNAIKNGAVNKAAYTKVSSDYSHDFVNHLDAVIASPFIEDNANCTAASVELIMADTDNIFSNLILVDGSSCKYIQFHVNSVPVTGANGIISVLDASGTVMWSWHIWVWSDDLTPIEIENATGVKYRIMPINLASKKDSNNEKCTCWYYQWGRPVPFLPTWSYKSGSDATNYGTKSIVTPKSYANSIGEAICKPNYLYGKDSTSGDWINKKIRNLWDAACTTTGASDNNVVKTVYDPCPVGFKMPNGNTFTGFTLDNTIGDFDYGWKFKKNGDDSTGVYFGALGYRFTAGVLQMRYQGYYHTSAPYYDTRSYGIYMSSTSVRPQYDVSFKLGCPIRPVQE